MSNCPSLASTVAARFCTVKLVVGKCQVQSPVALVDLAVFRVFLRNSRKYGQGSLRKSSTERTPPFGPGPKSGQLAFNLQLTYGLMKVQHCLLKILVATKYTAIKLNYFLEKCWMSIKHCDSNWYIYKVFKLIYHFYT